MIVISYPHTRAHPSNVSMFWIQHTLAKRIAADDTPANPGEKPKHPTFYFCGHDFNLYFRFIYTRVEKQRAVTIPKQVEKITFPSRREKKKNIHCYLYSNFIAVPFIYMLFMYRNATQFQTTSERKGEVNSRAKRYTHIYIAEKHTKHTHTFCCKLYITIGKCVS